MLKYIYKIENFSETLLKKDENPFVMSDVYCEKTTFELAAKTANA